MAHGAAHHHGHHGGTLKAYISVFAALSVFTIISFVANSMVRQEALARGTAFAIILGVAVVKAILVAVIFMHLKWDWRKLYFMIVPAFIIAPALVIALLPDIVIYWKNFYRVMAQ